VRSAAIIREARLRAGLTQAELAKRTGRERSVIARWEQGAVSPSVETVLALVEACGFDLPLELVPAEPADDKALRKNLLLSPERQVQRALRKREKSRPSEKAASPSFDPYALLGAFERRRVAYVLIGAFARVLRGADELTYGLDLAPSLREPNLRRLEAALADLGAERPEGQTPVLDEEIISAEPLIRLVSPHGELGVVPEPAGTRRGYDDLRRAATREHLGHGVRPQVASTADLARMLAALGRDADLPKLRAMRRLTEFEQSAGHELNL
jgi:transcriptional regulator with XRE-family HTH domain